MAVQALIFDCDGVLVDSELLSVRELGRTLRKAGVAITDQQIFERMIGRSQASIIEMMRDEQKVDVSTFLAGHHARLRQSFTTGLRPVPGIAAAIRAMDDLPRIVASSSEPSRIVHSLQVTGLAELFGDRICSSVEVAHGKPAPDLFLLAAKRLGVDPADCIVIEDSEVGVIAAKAAGMRVIGFLAGRHASLAGLERKLTRLGPDAIARSASELPVIVTGLVDAAQDSAPAGGQGEGPDDTRGGKDVFGN
jgi:HAD superfamily hydrolase (TIGR01509 family)